MLGTPYEPDLKRSILFLEDITEEPYRVDRMIAQLRNASILTNSAAMLIGQFTDCVPLDPTKPSLNTEEIIREYLTATKRPVLSNLPFGHVPQKMTLPIGLQVAINADKGTLDYLEAAVA
jgi:muramoyltetrapeptide carboxypeptidase